MRERAVRMILTAVLTVVVMLGVPGAIMAGVLVWITHQSDLESRTHTLARAVDRRLEEGEWVTQATVASWSRPLDSGEVSYTVVQLPADYEVISGSPKTAPVMTSRYRSNSGVIVEMQVSAYRAIRGVVTASSLFVAGSLVSLTVGSILARKMARK